MNADLEVLEARLETARSNLVHVNQHNEVAVCKAIEAFQTAHNEYMNALAALDPASFSCGAQPTFSKTQTVPNSEP